MKENVDRSEHESKVVVSNEHQSESVVGNDHQSDSVISNELTMESLDTDADVIQIDHSQFCNQEVVNSIAKKESEILSMLMLNGEVDECEQAVASVKSEPFVTNNADDAVVATTDEDEVDASQHVEIQQALDMVDAGDLVTMEFHAADAAWITLFDSFEFVINNCRIRGYVEGEKKFLSLWECFQTSTMSTFTVRSSDRYYRDATKGEEGAINGRILKGAPKWSRTPLIPYDGVPFVSIDRKYFGCRLGGSERKNTKKGQYKTSRTGHSVKVGCPAEADVLEVWRIPDLSVPDGIKSSREMRRVKSKLLAKVYDYISLEKFTKRYYVTLPLITKHKNHPILDTQAGRLKVLHPKIIEQIYDIVSQGIYEKRVVKYMLHEYVQQFQNQLGIEIQLTDRSFYPTDRDIGNHIRNARHLCKNDDVVMENAPHADSVVVDADGTDEGATSNVVPSLSEIPTTCDVTYGIAPIDSTSVFSKTTECDSTSFVETVSESNLANFTDNVAASKSYLITQDVNSCSIENIVQNGMLDLIQNGGVGETNDDITGITDANHAEIKTLIEEAKKNPNPSKQKKMRRSWPHKLKSMTAQKPIDLKALLKAEIDNSFAVINQALVNEQDEMKLKLILKKVKALQRVVQGKEAVKKRGKRSGIQAMVDIENLKESVT